MYIYQIIHAININISILIILYVTRLSVESPWPKKEHAQCQKNAMATKSYIYLGIILVKPCPEKHLSTPSSEKHLNVLDAGLLKSTIHL